MAIARLGTGFSDLGKDFANGASASQLISKSMGLLVSSIMAANSLLKIQAVQAKLSALTLSVQKAATDAATTSTGLFAGAL